MTRCPFSLSIVLLLFCITLSGCAERDDATLVVTSDTHISNPEGRWPERTDSFSEFVRSLIATSVDHVFIVGDIVDNAPKVLSSDNVNAGEERRDYLRREYSIYNDITSRSDIKFLHTYGPGHDFNKKKDLAFAEKITGNARRGAYRWGNVDLIWLTVYTASYSNTTPSPPAMFEDDYRWLRDALSKTDRAILLWHVPVRTTVTERRGQWENDTNLSIPTNDDLYPILDTYSDKIMAIFNGHIHKSTKTHYNDIPVFLCPFDRNQCHCKLSQRTSNVSVIPVNCLEQTATDLPFNN